MPRARAITGDALFTPVEAADFFGQVSAETLVQWRSQGRGPRYVKVERRLVRYRRSDLCRKAQSLRTCSSIELSKVLRSWRAGANDHCRLA